MIRLTSKEIARGDASFAIISRPQSKGGYKVMAVRIAGLEGAPLGRVYTETVETKGQVSQAAKEIARWLSKMSFPCWRMADAARHR